MIGDLDIERRRERCSRTLRACRSADSAFEAGRCSEWRADRYHPRVCAFGASAGAARDRLDWVGPLVAVVGRRSHRVGRLPDSADVRKTRALAGIVGPATFVTAAVLAGRRAPGYSH